MRAFISAERQLQRLKTAASCSSWREKTTVMTSSIGIHLKLKCIGGDVQSVAYNMLSAQSFYQVELFGCKM